MGEFEILGTRLKLLRKRLKVNQTEFSKMIGISSATLSAYETGVKNPSLAVLKNIAETCNVSIDWLCGLSDKESFSDNIRTYSDIIKILIEIEKYINVDFNIFNNYQIDNFIERYLDKTTQAEIVFHSETIARFVNDWRKMANLHSSGTIDDNLYSLWVNQQLDLYRIDLPKKNANISNNQTNNDKINDNQITVYEIDDDDELPF